jgi:hypothetical protein
LHLNSKDPEGSKKYILVGKYQGKMLLGISRHKWIYDILMHLRDTDFQNVNFVKTL